MKSKKIYIFLGTTAEFIKLAPVIKELKANNISFTVIASGQNNVSFEELHDYTGGFDIVYAVKSKSNKSSLFMFSLWSIKALFSLIIGMRNFFRYSNNVKSYVIVHGDTVSSLLGAIVAKFYGLKLVHIEAGLRSFDYLEPFPEEISRVCISKLADIHFCPNDWAVKNIESTNKKVVNTYQNTLYDMYQYAKKIPVQDAFLKSFFRKKHPYFVLVVHRQEHVLFQKEQTKELLANIFRTIPKHLYCVLMVHDLSANFIDSLDNSDKDLVKRIVKIPRVPYTDFMHVLKNSEFVITDGGSNQEELSYMGKPCLLLRNRTERIEGLNNNVVLSKNNLERITDFIHNYKIYQKPYAFVKKSPSRIIVSYLQNKT